MIDLDTTILRYSHSWISLQQRFRDRVRQLWDATTECVADLATRFRRTDSLAVVEPGFAATQQDPVDRDPLAEAEGDQKVDLGSSGSIQIAIHDLLIDSQVPCKLALGALAAYPQESLRYRNAVNG